MDETGGEEQAGYVDGTWLLSSFDLLTGCVLYEGIRKRLYRVGKVGATGRGMGQGEPVCRSAYWGSRVYLRLALFKRSSALE